MIELVVDGTPFEGFTDISVNKTLEAISGDFTFTATSSNVSSFPIKRGSPCKVQINGQTVIDGFIDTISVSYSASDHSISITGRDKTADIIDSTMIGDKEFNPPIGLVQIIKKALSDNGISNVNVINNAGTIAPFQKGDFVSASIGMTVFEFIELYTRKRQVLLTTNGDGDVVLARAGNTNAVGTLQHVIGGRGNNILASNINYDETARYSRYILKSQNNHTASSSLGMLDLTQSTNQKGQATDSDIRSSRVLEIYSKSTDNSADLKNLAIWNANLRRAKSADYKVTVQGFFQDENKSRLWSINELVQVVDDFADVNATLLVKSVNYKLNLQNGSTTEIGLVDKDAYTLQAQIDAADKKANKQGKALTLKDIFPSA